MVRLNKKNIGKPKSESCDDEKAAKDKDEYGCEGCSEEAECLIADDDDYDET